jgi:hypothetical protein
MLAPWQKTEALRRLAQGSRRLGWFELDSVEGGWDRLKSAESGSSGRLVGDKCRRKSAKKIEMSGTGKLPGVVDRQFAVAQVSPTVPDGSCDG